MIKRSSVLSSATIFFSVDYLQSYIFDPTDRQRRKRELLPAYATYGMTLADRFLRWSGRKRGESQRRATRSGSYGLMPACTADRVGERQFVLLLFRHGAFYLYFITVFISLAYVCCRSFVEISEESFWDKTTGKRRDSLRGIIVFHHRAEPFLCYNLIRVVISSIGYVTSYRGEFDFPEYANSE